MTKDTGETRKPLTLTEKIRNVCIGVGALSALILGLVANFKGEPVAEEATKQVDKTWKTLRIQVNKQSDVINKLHLRMVHLQGMQEGFNAGKLQEKLNQLQRKYDTLSGEPRVLKKKQASLRPKRPTTAKRVRSKPSSLEDLFSNMPKKDCPPGLVEAEGKCRKVPQAVAKRVSDDKQKMLEAKRRLEEGRRQREELERKRKELEQKVKQQNQQEVPKLRPLPAKLDDAAGK